MAGQAVNLPPALHEAFRWQLGRYRAAWSSVVQEEASIVYGPHQLDVEEKALFLALGTCVFGVTFSSSAGAAGQLWAHWSAPRGGNGDEMIKGDMPVRLVISHEHPDLDPVAGAWLISDAAVVEGQGSLCLEVDLCEVMHQESIMGMP